jgi:aryl-alcohol dehydrogenase-like predicted oxidoreductase
LAAERKGSETGFGGIPRRPLGGTGVQVSALGVGGHHLGDFPTVDEAIRLVHEAVDAGATVFDNCVLGRALKGRRDKVFLMTEVCTQAVRANREAGLPTSGDGISRGSVRKP